MNHHNHKIFPARRLCLCSHPSFCLVGYSKFLQGTDPEPKSGPREKKASSINRHNHKIFPARCLCLCSHPSFCLVTLYFYLIDSLMPATATLRYSRRLRERQQADGSTVSKMLAEKVESPPPQRRRSKRMKKPSKKAMEIEEARHSPTAPSVVRKGKRKRNG